MSTRQEQAVQTQLPSSRDRRLEATQKIVGEVFETLRSLEDSDFTEPDSGQRKALYRTRNALDRLENAMLGIPGVRAPMTEIAKGMGIDTDRGILETHVEISDVESAGAAPQVLAQRQHAIASEFPGEYTVLVGTRVVFHSKNREEALYQYDAAHGGASEESPVFIAPGTHEPVAPNVLRGRTISRP